MKYLKGFMILAAFTGISLSAFSKQVISLQTITNKQHPRILLIKGEEIQISRAIEGNVVWKKMHNAIVSECNNFIALAPVERIQIGRRLLDKSREALRRIFYLSYAWRLTGEEKYFRRCETELLAVSGFSDWNPSHFLDVAEMTMAVAIGYDWLYPKLSENSRKVIREAMVTKGLNLSFDPKYNGWVKAVHNWNQVCNAGMTFGALAVAEDYPELAKNVIERAVESIKLPMGEYNPDGAYPEGYTYWGYGTSFNVMFLSAIEKVFLSDFGLNDIPGFLKTAGFLENMTGVSRACYNWGDCGSGGELNPAMFWFAQHNSDPSLLWVEKSSLQRSEFNGYTRDRLLPAVMIWGKDLPLDRITEPKGYLWCGQGANPVCLMRTSWSDPNAIFLGFKAGSASVNHGHMDIGSFVLEADGLRWASDFGMQDYESLESKGIEVFGRTQDAQRWTIFRTNNKAHNTITVDNQLQKVKGYAKIDRFSDNPELMFAISDLSGVYENQLKSAKRGVAIVDRRFVVVSDEVVSLNKPTTIRWTMMTTATPVLEDERITLSKEGHQLFIQVKTGGVIKMKTWPTEPATGYDAPNPGTSLVGFEMELKPNQKKTIQVLLIPGSSNRQNINFKKRLNSW